MITRIVRNSGCFRACFYIETISALTTGELSKLYWVIAETFEPLLTSESSSSEESVGVEIGPRLCVETPFSTNAVAICRAMGIDKVVRIERSEACLLAGTIKKKILAEHLDRMTQEVYPKGVLF